MVVKEETLASASRVLRKIELQVDASGQSLSWVVMKTDSFINLDIWQPHLSGKLMEAHSTKALGGGAQRRDVSLCVAMMAGEEQHLFSP